nr:response regulator transcription factor [Allobranchiibius huperziae]
MDGARRTAHRPDAGPAVTIRVFLVDDQPLLRQGFSMILGAQEDMEVVGEASDGAQALVDIARAAPDVVLMDVRMPGMNGIDATRAIATNWPDVRVIILTTFDLDEYAFEGLRAGASGFLLKNAQTDEFVRAVRAVSRGDAVIAPSTTRRLLESYAGAFTALRPSRVQDDAIAELTARERDVFDQVAAGLSNGEISTCLTLSEATVKTHVARILRKLGLRDRVQVVIYAYESGLARPR